jgi:hypothetical protein
LDGWAKEREDKKGLWNDAWTPQETTLVAMIVCGGVGQYLDPLFWECLSPMSFTQF